MTRAQELRKFWQMLCESLPDEDGIQIGYEQIGDTLCRIPLCFEAGSFQLAITEMIEDLDRGKPFNIAMDKHDFFSPMEVLLIRHGELIGKVEIQIQRIANSPNVFTRSRQLDLFWEIMQSGIGRVPSSELIRLAVSIFDSEFEMKAQMKKLTESIRNGSLLSETISKVPLFSQDEIRAIINGEDDDDIEQAIGKLLQQ